MRTSRLALRFGRPRFLGRIDQVFLQLAHCRRRLPNRLILVLQHGDFACRAIIHENYPELGAESRRKKRHSRGILQQNFFTHPQIVTSKSGRGGRRHLPGVFTEHGAVMLSSVLHTPVAIDASLLIARAFIKLRQMIGAHKELAKGLKELERRVTGHDDQIEGIIETIRQLEAPPTPPSRKIGFQP